MHSQRVLKPAPCGLIGFSERRVVGQFDSTSRRVDYVAQSVPRRIIVVVTAPIQVRLEPRLKPRPVDDAKGGVEGLVEISCRACVSQGDPRLMTVLNVVALPLVYLHAVSGSGSGFRSLDNCLSIFNRRVMSVVKVLAASWKLELPVLSATH